MVDFTLRNREHFSQIFCHSGPPNDYLNTESDPVRLFIKKAM